MASSALAILLILTCSHTVLAIEEYTTNAICRQNNCVNPIVPGLDDLSTLQSLNYVCESNSDVLQYMSFCKDVITWDVGIVSTNSTVDLKTAVAAQDDAALTMYFYHLSGLYMEPWKYESPSSSGSYCVEGVWEMVCKTYFPKATSGCTSGQRTKYLRPCKSSCYNYLYACDVDCCDESVQCVFNSSSSSSGATEGYYDAEGPSEYCTGAATPQACITWVVLLAMLAFHAY